MRHLRPYQKQIVDAAMAHFAGGGHSALAVAATGVGKTVIFAEVARRVHEQTGLRTLVVAHRDELIRSAVAKLRQVTGIEPEVEKAQERARRDDGLAGDRSPFVVASVQTLISGRGAHKRMHDFRPHEFGLIVIDECHHASSSSYLAVVRHFVADGAKVLGVTATADRADGVSLSGVFEAVVGRYELPDAIADGYLVPIWMRGVAVAGLDYSKCRMTAAGSLRDEDVAQAIESAMAEEADWHPVAHAVLEAAYGLEPQALEGFRDLPFAQRQDRLLELSDARPVKRTLIFCPTVATSRRLADIFNRWSEGIAAHVDGETPADERANVFRMYGRGTCPILCNCGIATEGTDLPETEVVVLVRKTKSRPLMAQMVGRGTRPSPAVADAISAPGTTPEQRRGLIAASAKPHVTVLDFIGNCGPHRLVGPADLLAGESVPTEVLARAQEIAAGREMPVADAVAAAEREIEEERELARRMAEAEANDLQRQAEQQFWAQMRRDVVATTTYTLRDVGGSGVGTDAEPALPGMASAVAAAPRQGIGTATEGQVDLLVRYGVKPETARAMGKGQAGQVINGYQEDRERRGLARFPLTAKQIQPLVRAGYDRAEVVRLLDGANFSPLFEAVRAAGWRKVAPTVGESLVLVNRKGAA